MRAAARACQHGGSDDQRATHHRAEIGPLAQQQRRPSNAVDRFENADDACRVRRDPQQARAVARSPGQRRRDVPTPPRIVRIKYDQRTGDSWEYLVAAVRALKGHDDYKQMG